MKPHCCALVIPISTRPTGTAAGRRDQRVWRRKGAAGGQPWMTGLWYNTHEQMITTPVPGEPTVPNLKLERQAATGVVADPTILGELLLFRDLPPEHLRELNTVLRRRTVPAGTDLITAEEPGDIAYIIRNGTVKIHGEQADGSSVILAILGPGEIVGEMSLIENSDRSASVVTLEESTLFWMNRDTFDACLHSMPQLTY